MADEDCEVAVACVDEVWVGRDYIWQIWFSGVDDSDDALVGIDSWRCPFIVAVVFGVGVDDDPVVMVGDGVVQVDAVDHRAGGPEDVFG